MPPFNSYFEGLHVRQFFTKKIFLQKNPPLLLIAMFEGNTLNKHSENMGIKSICDRMFTKYLIENI